MYSELRNEMSKLCSEVSEILSAEGAELESNPETLERIDDPLLPQVEKLEKEFSYLKSEGELLEKTIKQVREALEAVSFLSLS